MRKLAIFFLAASLFANPSGEKVIAGDVSVQETCIVQHSDQAIVHWQDFSIEKGESVKIVQPKISSKLLNRVIGKNPSKIYGSLEANGRVYLLNQNGIFIGPKGRIDTASFLASTLDITDQEFLKGTEMIFSGDAKTSIINFGCIETKWGDVYLLSRKVENFGTIDAKDTVVLSGASEILLKENTKDRVFIRPGAEGALLNEGTIAGVQAILKAAGGNAFSLALNQKGLIQANSTVTENGRVLLIAEEGIAQVPGRIEAKEGGSVYLLGDLVGVLQKGVIDISSREECGEVLIGGDFQGKNENIKNAKLAFIDEKAQVFAQSATQDGGKVIVWGDEQAQHFGFIDVSGAENGGFIEVSSPAALLYKGEVDLAGLRGKPGSLLLDPGDVTVGVIASNPAFPTSPGNYNPAVGPGDLNVTDLVSAVNGLNSGNVTISTSAGAFGNGDVFFTTAVSWNAATTLTVLADRLISITADITNSHSGSGNFTAMDFRANQAGTTTGTFDALTVNGANITSTEGNISLLGIGGTSINDRAIAIEGGSMITSMGSGADAATITLNGTGGAALDDAFGVDLTGSSSIISQDGAISITGGSNGTRADNIGIQIDGTSSISSTGTGANAATITLLGTGGVGSGDRNQGVHINATSTIATNDGNIMITGNGNSDGSAASNQNDGIFFEGGSTITSLGTGASAGTITLIGQGGAGGGNNEGVNLSDNNTLLTSIDGDISITGTSLGTGTTCEGITLESNAVVSSTGTGVNAANITFMGTGGPGTSDCQGINIISNNTQVLSMDGNITMTGQGGGSTTGNDGIRIQNSADVLISGTGSISFTGTASGGSNGAGVELGGASVTTISGNIDITGQGLGGAGGPGLQMQSGASLGSGSTTGDITITVSGINLVNSVESTGTLTIQPNAAGLTMGVGGAATGTVFVSTGELNVIQNGFTELIFGRVDGTAAFEIGTFTFNDPVTMRTQTGPMTVLDPLATSGGEAITLISDVMAINNTVTGTGTLTIEPGQASTTIGIGNAATGTLNLDLTELGNLTNGFSGITIGRSDQDSTVDIQAVTFNDPITIIGKQIDVSSTLNAGANTATFNIGPASDGTFNLNALVTASTTTVTGAAFNDTFNINISGQTATTNGGGGTENTLNGPSAVNTWNITADNAGNLATITFLNMNNLGGNNMDDTFNLSGAFQISGTTGMDGGVGGTNTLNGPNVTTIWNALTTTSGNINPTGATGPSNFLNMNALNGGSGDDTFNLSPDITIPTINAGGGTNTLTFLAGWTIPAVINLDVTTGFQVINGPPGLDNFLTGNNLANTWTITADNAGTLVNATFPIAPFFTFTNFPNVLGNTNTDDFTFNGAFQVGGSVGIDGAGGANTLTGPNVNTTWNVLSQTSGTIFPTGATGATSYANIPTLTGGSADDVFNLSPDITIPTIDAGLGNNTLTFLAGWTIPANIDLDVILNFTTINGPPGLDNTLTGNNLANTWNITGDNAGTLENTTYPFPNVFNFTNFPNVNGDANTDDFIFDGAFQLSGTTGINGAGNTNTVSGPNVNNAWTVTGNNAGSINPTGSSGATLLSSIQTFTGGTANDDFVFTANAFVGTINGNGGTNTVTGPNFVNAWSITGNDTGLINPGAGNTILTDIQNFTGGTAADNFTFLGAFQLTGTPGINGSSGANTLTAPNVNNTWTVTADDSGTLNPTGAPGPTTFVAIPAITGGTMNDDVTFSGAFQMSGGIDGNMGTNTLTGPNVVNAWVITANDAGRITPTGATGLTNFTDMQSLTGGTMNDGFTFSAAAAITNGINGNGGTNTVTGPDVNNAWAITADDIATITPTAAGTTTLTDVQILTGGAGNDAFTFNGAFQISGSINGGGGTNQITAPNVVNTWTITGNDAGTLNPTGATGPTTFTTIGGLVGGTMDDAYIFTGAFQISGVGLVGNGGTNTLTAPNVNNDWTISADNAGSINPTGSPGPTLFSSIPTLTGGTANDDFTFLTNAQISGGIDGNGGTNSVTGPDFVTPWFITGNNTGTINPMGATGLTNLTDIQNFSGGSQADTFTFNGAFQLSGTIGINGGGGTNILNAPNVNNAWTVTANNAGTINPTGSPGATNFSNIPTLTGGTMNDDIVFTANAQMSGGIDGNGGTNTVTGPDVNTTWTITADDAGTLDPGAGVTTLTDIQSLTGGTANDDFTFTGAFQISGGLAGGLGVNTLTGPDVNTTWTIVTANDQGTINPMGATGLTTFTGMGALNGGTGADDFTMIGALQLTGAGIDGGTGANTFTAPNVNNTWTITGNSAGTISPTGASGPTNFANIPALTGGTANDAITFLVNAVMSGGINGNGGTNSVTGPNSVTAWTITGNDTGTIDPGAGVTTLTDIQSFSGGNLADTFTFTGAFQISAGLDGGTGGFNVLAGPNVTTVWNVLSQTSGNITPMGAGTTNYANIDTLNGGSGDDTYNLSPDITIPTINAGGGVNTLTFLPGWTIPANIDLNVTTGFQVINGPPGLQNILTGNNLANTWHFTADNAGTLENTTFPLPTLFTFTNFPNINGGTSIDAFIFDGAFQISGVTGINGGLGPNSLTAPNVNNTWTVTGNDAGTINPTGATGPSLFSSIPALVGGTMNDDITFTANAQMSGGIDGNGGTNTVTGPDFVTAWTVSADDAGTINPGAGITTLTDIQTFTGGAMNDTFTFNGAFQISGGINGGLGVNTTIGPNFVNAWTITADNTGTINPTGSTGPTILTEMQNFTGGSANDNFTFTGAFQLTGAINGSNGTNAITGPDVNTTWTISSDDTGMVSPTGATGPTSFSSIGSLNGGSMNDAFIFGGAFQVSGNGIDGGLGANTLTAPNVNNTWTVTADDTGTIFPTGATGLTNFTNIPALTGGTANDDISFTAAAQMSGGIDGNGGTNSVLGPDVITAWTITGNDAGTIFPMGATGLTTLTDIQNLAGGALNDTFTFTGAFQISGATGINGGGGANILNAPNVNNTWTVTGNSAGTIFPTGAPGATNFLNIPAITGGTANDDITFNANAFMSGGIDGNGGTNTVTGPNFNTTWSITANDGGSLDPGAGVTTLTDIQTFTGGMANDDFTFTGAFQITGGIAGGVGTNTLTGPNINTTWTVTANDTGTINPMGAAGATNYSGIGALTGGLLNDDFSITGAFQLTGAGIDGGMGTNTLTAPNINNSWTVTGNNAGTIFPTGASGATSFVNIPDITGGSANDDIVFVANATMGTINGNGGTNTVTGPNFVTTWSITGNDAGIINPGAGNTLLIDIQSFTGGTNSDSFFFVGAFQISGGIDGGMGTNDLNGPAVTTVWNVLTQTTGNITPMGAGTTNYQNIATLNGNSGDDTFNLSPDITIPVINAGGGLNTLTFLAGWTIPANIDLNITTGFQVINGPPGLENSLTGNNLANIWHFTGDDQGTLENTTFPLPTLFTFTNFPNINGGSSSDSFIFDGAFQISGTVGIVGNAGANSITAPNVVNAWTVTGDDQGTIFPTGATGASNFSGIPAITGGTVNDTITFTGAFQMSGGIDGNGGTNSIIGSNTNNSWTIAGNDAGIFSPTGASGPTPFVDVQNLTGNLSNDAFVFAGAFQITGTIDGGAGGTNSLMSPNLSTTWNVLTQTTGTIDPLGSPGASSYINIGTLIGGTGDDTFNLSPDITLPIINAGAGTDTLTFLPGWTIPALVDLNVITGFEVINGPPGLDNVLTGNNLTNIWHITGADAGTLENTVFPLPTPFSFTNFPNVVGGTVDDNFIFDGNFQLTGTVGINGNTGTNTITGPNLATIWNVLTQTTGNINPGVGATNYINVGTLIGGIGDDTFNLFPDLVMPIINAGAGTDTLTFLPGWTIPALVDLNTIIGFEVINGPPGLDNVLTGNNLGNIWHITADAAGTLENTVFPIPTIFVFSNFPNVTGGTVADSFIFDGAFQMGGSQGINGNTGTNSVTGPDVNNVWTITATNGGNISPTGASGVTGFSNIENLIGGALEDDFDFTAGFPVSSVAGGGGINTFRSFNSTWLITANDAGTVDGIPFSGIGNLVGGSMDDFFIFSDAVTLSGQVDGGPPAAGNVLDYTAFTVPVIITLITETSGLASNLANGFINIGSFIGNFICTNCGPTPPPPTPVVPVFPPERAQALQADLSLALTKEIDYFEWLYDHILFYDIYRSVLHTVLDIEDLVKWQIEDKVSPYLEEEFEESLRDI